MQLSGVVLKFVVHGVTVKPHELLRGVSLFLSHIFTILVIYNYIVMHFHGGLLFFLQTRSLKQPSLPLWGPYSALVFSNFSSAAETMVSWRLLIHIIKQENISNPILCSGMTKTCCRKQWYKR